LLSVWTSSEPGYFLPEEIAVGNVQTSDLIFGFSIPRSIAPEEVFTVMCNITDYAQKRLGGRLIGSDGKNFEKEKELLRIDVVLKNLEKESIQNGTGDALYLFQ
jgi:cell division protein ZipA